MDPTKIRDEAKVKSTSIVYRAIVNILGIPINRYLATRSNELISFNINVYFTHLILHLNFLT